MYNNRSFSTGSVAVQLFNPQHDVVEYLTSHMATLVPSTNDMYYVRSKNQKFIVTWNTTTRLVQIWEMDMNTFREMIMNNETVDNGYYVRPYKAIADVLLTALEGDFQEVILLTTPH